jgi:RecA/RadA recombinase
MREVKEKLNYYKTDWEVFNKIVGGVPKGRVFEVVAEAKAGKSTFLLQVAKEVQKEGKSIIYVDVERKMDIGYAENFIKRGKDKFLLVRGSTYEEVYLYIDEILKNKEYGEVGMIVIDSIGAGSSEVNMIRDINDNQVGVDQKVIKGFLKRLVKEIEERDITLALVQQYFSNVGNYTKKKGVTGGKFSEYVTSLRLAMKVVEKIEEDKGGVIPEIIGQVVEFNIELSSICIPYQKFVMGLIYGRGFDNKLSLLLEMKRRGMIKQKGSWWMVGDEKVLGWQKLIEKVKNDEKFYNKVLEIWGKEVR